MPERGDTPFGEFTLSAYDNVAQNEWVVTAYALGWKRVGEASFAGVYKRSGADYNGRLVGLKGWNVEVKKDYRRRGLARAMYAFAEETWHLPIIPGDVQTDEGNAFVANRKNKESALWVLSHRDRHGVWSVTPDAAPKSRDSVLADARHAAAYWAESMDNFEATPWPVVVAPPADPKYTDAELRRIQREEERLERAEYADEINEARRNPSPNDERAAALYADLIANRDAYHRGDYGWDRFELIQRATWAKIENESIEVKKHVWMMVHAEDRARKLNAAERASWKRNPVDLKRFDPAQVKKGIAEETKEHGKALAPRVVADHLALDPMYYAKGNGKAAAVISQRRVTVEETSAVVGVEMNPSETFVARFRSPKGGVSARETSASFRSVGAAQAWADKHVQRHTEVEIRGEYTSDGSFWKDHGGRVVSIRQAGKWSTFNPANNPAPRPSTQRRELRDKIRLTKLQAKEESREIRRQCKLAREELTEQRREFGDGCRNAVARTQLERDRKVALAQRAIAVVQADENARRIERGGQGLRRTSAEKREESDHAVAANLPAELWPVWQRVKGRIRGNARKSRTEAFLEWVQAHREEVDRMVADAVDDDVDRMVREYQQEGASVNPLPMKGKAITGKAHMTRKQAEKQFRDVELPKARGSAKAAWNAYLSKLRSEGRIWQTERDAWTLPEDLDASRKNHEDPAHRFQLWVDDRRVRTFPNKPGAAIVKQYGSHATVSDNKTGNVFAIEGGKLVNVGRGAGVHFNPAGLGPGENKAVYAKQLRAQKRLSAKNDGTFDKAIKSAAYHAKRNGAPYYIYPGNSYMRSVWRVTAKLADATNGVNNSGGVVLEVTPTLSVIQYQLSDRAPKKNPASPKPRANAAGMQEWGYVWQLDCLDPKGKAFTIKLGNHEWLMGHDPDGNAWPANEALIVRYTLTDENELAPEDVPNSMRKYAGRGPIYGGQFMAPSGADWKLVGVVHHIWYERTGTKHPGHWQHPYGEHGEPLPNLYTWTYQGQKFYRLCLGKGAVWNVRGFVTP